MSSPHVPAIKAFLVSLGVLGMVVAAPSVWHAAQRSYADFQCTGDLDAQGRCVVAPMAPGGGQGPGDPTMPASPLNGPGPSALPVPAPVGTPSAVPGTSRAATVTDQMPVEPYVDPIALLNVERQRAGIGPLRAHPALGQAAQAHTQYLVQNHQFAHGETPGAPGFLGATPQDRIRAVGYGQGEAQTSTGEVVATLGGDTSDGVSNLMGAIYHRFVMLTPTFQDVGAGVMTDGDSMVMTMDMGVRASTAELNAPLRVVVYPTPAQDGVPATFIPGNEVPNPVPERQRVGYPISVQVAPGHALAISALVLRDASNGQVLGGKVLSAATDGELTGNEWAFIPWDPLRPSARYEVSLSGSVDGQGFATQWSFDTAAEVPFQATVVQPVLHPGEQTWIRFSKTNASSWHTSAQSTGADNVPFQVVRQSWRGLVVQALPSCRQTEGCPVRITVTDDQGHASQVALLVMP